MNRSDYCHCCGALRGLAALRSEVGFNDIVVVEKHKPLLHGPGKSFEASPQLVVNVGVWRNGGCDDQMYVCDDCLRIGLRHALEKLTQMLV